MRFKQIIRLVIRYLLIILFMYAGLTKIWEDDLFYVNLVNSPVLRNQSLALIASWTVPLLEILTGVLLIIVKTVLKGFYLALFLLLVYTLYLIDLLFFSSAIPCTCRAFFQFLGWYGHLYFSIGCMFLIILAVISDPTIKLTNTSITSILLLRNKSRRTPKTCKKE